MGGGNVKAPAVTLLALRHPPLPRRPTRRDVEEAYTAARAASLRRFHAE